MDEETTKYLWGLKEINKSLITGLETAIFVMDKWYQLQPEKRESIIGKLKGLISKSKEAYETESTRH